MTIRAAIRVLLASSMGVLALGSGCLFVEGPPQDLRPVEVANVGVDRKSGTPVVILREREGLRRELPIFIGPYEARSIAMGLEGTLTPRPNPHDLIHEMILGLGGRVQRVVVTELKDSVYYAVIELQVDGRAIVVDARPSDAIAVALRFSAPLFVAASVLDEDGRSPARQRRQDV